MLLFETSSYDVQAPADNDWNSDDWETPDAVARFMASLLTGSEYLICEPFAGTGQILQYLPRGASVGREINPLRVEVCKATRSDCDISCYDSFTLRNENLSAVDTVVTNPPFSMPAEVLRLCRTLIANAKIKGRILLLLPTEYFQSQERAQILRESGLVITRKWAIAGRVAYLKQGVPYKKRQCYDSVFELRLSSYYSAAIKVVDPMRKLSQL